MTNKEKFELMTMIIVASEMDGDNNFDVNAEMLDSLPILQILKNKVDYFKIPVRITENAYFLLSVYSEGNPAFIQYLLYELLLKLKGVEDKVINVKSLVDMWPLSPPEMGEDFSRFWSDQKYKFGDSERGSENGVDFPQFWKEIE